MLHVYPFFFLSITFTSSYHFFLCLYRTLLYLLISLIPLLLDIISVFYHASSHILFSLHLSFLAFSLCSVYSCCTNSNGPFQRRSHELTCTKGPKTFACKPHLTDLFFVRIINWCRLIAHRGESLSARADTRRTQQLNADPGVPIQVRGDERKSENCYLHADARQVRAHVRCKETSFGD